MNTLFRLPRQGQPLFPTVVMVSLLTFVGLAGGTSASMTASTAPPQERILISIANDLWTDDTLYTLTTNGSGQTRLFDFHNHSQDADGRIWQPRVAPDGVTIHFSSDSGYLWTPASRNLFRIASDGTWWDQITPDVNSGQWNQPGPYGVVEGTVEKSNGDPWINAPIFLEGTDLAYSKADGSFRFEDVPEGRRWIVAYEPGDTSHFDAEEILVSTVSPWTTKLVPGSDSWMEFQNPVVHGDRIYHTLGINQIQWTDVSASRYVNVYTAAGSCTIPDVDGFDVAPSSGRLAIMDYGTGCPTNRGLYVADKDGNNLQLRVDMKEAGTTWCGAQEVFWSPDESKVALKACYDFGSGWQTHIFVYDATGGGYLGGITFLDTGYTLYNVSLHGWSPSGDWLLYSYYLDSADSTALDKVRVNGDGSLDTGSIVSLLAHVRLSGATWGNLKESYRIYLPLVGRVS